MKTKTAMAVIFLILIAVSLVPAQNRFKQLQLAITNYHQADSTAKSKWQKSVSDQLLLLLVEMPLFYRQITLQDTALQPITGLMLGAQLSGRLSSENHCHSSISPPGFISPLNFAKKCISSAYSSLWSGLGISMGLSGFIISISIPSSSFASLIAVCSRAFCQLVMLSNSTLPPGNFHIPSSPCFTKSILLLSIITGPAAIIICMITYKCLLGLYFILISSKYICKIK